MRRVMAWLGRFAASLLFRRLEVAGEERYPTGRPVLLVANHFNGVVDPIVITAALGHTPRFIAKAGLRQVPIGASFRLGVVVRAVIPGGDAAGILRLARGAMAWLGCD